MTKRLDKKFFEQDTLKVARGLLGKVLVRRLLASAGRRGKEIRGVISETEAYKGFADRASHAHKGKTLRTKIMFGNAGHAYVYMIYGMYYCLNVVTEREHYPAAVLIRGIFLTDLQGPSKMSKIDGPGKVCRHFHIDKSLNGEDITKSDKLWIESAPVVPARKITRSPRIGVDYAGKCKERPWRFSIY